MDLGEFQNASLGIAIIVLLICLVILALILMKTTNTSTPIIDSCPDYWTVDGSGNNTQCINTKDLGTCPSNSGSKHLIMNFNNAPYVGSNSLCAKYTWAKSSESSKAPCLSRFDRSTLNLLHKASKLAGEPGNF